MGGGGTSKHPHLVTQPPSDRTRDAPWCCSLEESSMESAWMEIVVFLIAIPLARTSKQLGVLQSSWPVEQNPPDRARERQAFGEVRESWSTFGCCCPGHRGGF